MIDWGVPDVPESLQLKIKRENFLAKQALTDNIEASRSPVSVDHLCILNLWNDLKPLFTEKALLRRFLHDYSSW